MKASTMPYHVISGPDQVREVLRRVDDFEPTNALTSVVPLCPAALRILSRARFALPPVLASATGGQHRTVRQAVARFFTPAKVAALTPRVRELAAGRLTAASALLAHGPVDLADVAARHIPPLIMADLTGVDCPDLLLLKRWSKDSLELFWGWPDDARQLVLAESAAEFYAWLRQQVLDSRGTSNLFGVLHEAGLGTAQICSLGYFLVIAGQETTAQLMNITLHRALREPGIWSGLASGGSGREFVQRVLGTESSVHTWRRFTTRDTELGGTTLPAGAEILLELSGNHPEDASPTAYSLAFGHGLHRCLGAKLAELETVIVLEETARALPNLQPAGAEPDWTRLLSFQTPATVFAGLTTGLHSPEQEDS